MKKMFISTLIALASSSLLANGITIQTAGSPAYPLGGKFYGYRSSGEGPGATAFDEILKLAVDNHVLLFVVWGKDGCATCSQYISNLDEASRAAPKMLSYRHSMNAYFRGRSDGTGPAACVACYDFLRDTVGASGNCHIMAAYGVCEDGTVYKRFCPLITDYTTSGKKKIAWCDEFAALCEKHKWTPPKTDVVFECGTTATTRLEAMPETERVFVPFIRTNNLACAAHYQMRATFVNGQSVDIDMDWTNGQKRAEVDLYMTGRYQNGERLQLVIVNEQGEETLTNHLYCVESKANSFSHPYLVAETNANGYAFGEWTLNYDYATNGVLKANTFLYPDTNKTPAVITRSYPQNWSTSNRCETVYSANLEDFPKEVVGFNWEFPLLASNSVVTVYTNNLELIGKAREDVPFETKFEFAYTNTVTTVYMTPTVVLPSASTNYDERIEHAVGVTNRCEYVVAEVGEPELWKVVVDDYAFTVTGTNVTQYATDSEKAGQVTVVTNIGTKVCAVAGVSAFYNASKTVEGKETVNFPTNIEMQCKYTVMPGSAVTNRVFFAPVYTNFTLEVDVTTKLQASKQERVEIEYTGEVSDTVRVPDTATYYSAVSNDFTVSEQSFGFAETNRVYYTFNGGTTTNADESAFTEVATNGTVSVTNSVTTIYGTNQGSVEYELRENVFTVKVSDSYAGVETNAYQYGSAAGKERSDLPYQSYALKVTGSPVWDAKSVAFKAVFDNADFKEWCVSNHIATVLNETSDPETGASLFSHKVAANGSSGTPFISSKGISVLDKQVPVGEGFKVELVRPDGVVAGALTPQFNTDGSCDVTENLARIAEFVLRTKTCDVAVDPTEPANNATNATPLTVAFGGGATEINSVQINDRHDFFKVTGLTADQPFQVDLTYLKDMSSTPNVPYFEVIGGCRQLASNVWVATQAQIASGVYVAVSGWDGAAATTGMFKGNTVMYYTLSVAAAPEDKGQIGFAGPLDWTTEVGGVEQLAITVYRSGYTGAAKATVTLDAQKTTVPADRYVWKTQTIDWAANLSGTQTVYVTVKNVDWSTDISNLVFTVAATGAALDETREELTIGLSEEIDPEALTGSVAITSPATDAKAYVFGNQEVDILLKRFGERREVSKRDEARGEVVATLKTTFGEFIGTSEVSWAQRRTDEKPLTLRVGDLGILASKEFRVTMTAVDEDGKNIAAPGSNTVTFVAIPSDSTSFLSDLDKTVVQYVAVDETVALKSVPDGKTVSSLSRISGVLAPGLSYKLDKDAGAIRITGTPTTPGTYESLWWIRLRRLDGTYAYTMPVSIRFAVRPLGESSEAGSPAVNPSFATARSWTGLPVLDTNGCRLVGTLDMTMSKTGRFSARYRRMGGKMVSFSASALTAVDLATGLATVEAARRLSGVDYALVGDFAGNCGVTVSLDDPAYAAPLSVTIAENSKCWSKDHAADAWSGNYVAAFGLGAVTNVKTLCTGPMVMRFKFDTQSQWNKGSVTYQGYLPNGKSVSGSATFVPVAEGDDVTSLALFFSNTSETFTALPTFTTESQVFLDLSTAVPLWDHVEGTCTDASYGNDYPLLSAGLWDKGGRTAFSGRVTGTDGETLTYTVNRTSGLVSGTYRNSGAGISSAAYHGVALDETLIVGGYSYNLRKPEWGKTVKKGDALAIEE